MLARRFEKWKILWFTFYQLRKADEKEADEAFTLVGSGDTYCLLLSGTTGQLRKQRNVSCTYFVLSCVT
jgi:hypothetical protein